MIFHVLLAFCPTIAYSESAKALALGVKIYCQTFLSLACSSHGLWLKEGTLIHNIMDRIFFKKSVWILIRPWQIIYKSFFKDLNNFNFSRVKCNQILAPTAFPSYLSTSWLKAAY